MIEFLAIVDWRQAPDDDAVSRLLRRAEPNSEGSLAVARTAGEPVFAATAASWQGPAEELMFVGDRWMVAAHASIYFRQDLARALSAAGTAPPRPDAPGAEWIHQALVSWGSQGVQRLEGDFAFVAWDRVERRLLAGRDHTGSRTLYFTSLGSGIAVASSIRALRRLPGVPTTLNVVAFLEDAAHLDLASVTDTAYAAITRLPAGHLLEWSARSGAAMRRWWEVPIFETGPSVPFAEATAELRRLLVEATATRMAPVGSTAIMLSGGYDSTAVYAASQLGGRGGSVHAVSLSHAVGDPGRENELIEMTTRAFGREPNWVESESLPELGDPRARAARRDEPLYHTYELWNDALASACLATGARVGLNGVGGDAWFSCSPIFMADLFRRLQWREMTREWRLHVGRFKWYPFYRNVLLPNLPEGALRAATWLRGGRRPRHSNFSEIPGWVRGDLRERGQLEARRHIVVRRRRGESLAAAERSWFLQSPFPERIGATVARICEHAGIELRSPLNDARLVRFAATRPRWECNSRFENKHLLRAAMRDILPGSITAKRPERTGLPTRYLVRTLRAHAAFALPYVRRQMILADLGVVDLPLLVADLERCATAEPEWLMDRLALTDIVQAEFWLRSEGDVPFSF